MTLQLQEEDFETSTSILNKTLVSLLFFQASPPLETKLDSCCIAGAPDSSPL